jgi:hypothetical protein
MWDNSQSFMSIGTRLKKRHVRLAQIQNELKGFELILVGNSTRETLVPKA